MNDTITAVTKDIIHLIYLLRIPGSNNTLKIKKLNKVYNINSTIKMAIPIHSNIV